MEEAWAKCSETIGDHGEQVATLKCLTVVFQSGLNWAIGLAGAVALIFIIISGFKFVGSGGDPKQVEGARKTLTYAIIGLVIVLLSFFIINVISFLTGVTCIKQFGIGNCGP